jgi:hypothetical protein
MHWIQALVAPRNVFAGIRDSYPTAAVRLLPQNLCLVPITEDFAASLGAAGLAAGDPVEMPAQEMTPGVCAFAADASFRGPVVFVATYIHGGTGGQDALVWAQGKLVGSFHEDEDSMSTWPNSSISRALRQAGVVARPGEDEFDAIGLGTHRSTEGWAEGTDEILPRPASELRAVVELRSREKP